MFDDLHRYHHRRLLSSPFVIVSVIAIVVIILVVIVLGCGNLILQLFLDQDLSQQFECPNYSHVKTLVSVSVLQLCWVPELLHEL